MGQQDQLQQVNADVIRSLGRFTEEFLSTYRHAMGEILALHRRSLGEVSGSWVPESVGVAIGSPAKDRNRATIGRLFHEVIPGRFELIEQYASGPAVERLRKTWGTVRALMPDCQIVVEDIYTSEQDKLAARLRITGTHTGSSEDLDIEPTKRKVNVEAVEFFVFQEGRIVESWSVIDFSQFARQLEVEVDDLTKVMA